MVKEVSLAVYLTAAYLQERISAAVNNGEFTVKEFKALEEKYRVYLYSFDTEVQKTPASEMSGKHETIEDINCYLD